MRVSWCDATSPCPTRAACLCRPSRWLYVGPGFHTNAPSAAPPARAALTDDALRPVPTVWPLVLVLRVVLRVSVWCRTKQTEVGVVNHDSTVSVGLGASPLALASAPAESMYLRLGGGSYL